jgi:DNA modification methylase
MKTEMVPLISGIETGPLGIAHLRFAIALTTDEDLLVYDPMAGSGVVPLVAEQMGRRWLAGDRSREYIRSAQIRFASAGRPIELHHAA